MPYGVPHHETVEIGGTNGIASYFEVLYYLRKYCICCKQAVFWRLQ